MIFRIDTTTGVPLVAIECNAEVEVFFDGNAYSWMMLAEGAKTQHSTYNNCIDIENDIVQITKLKHSFTYALVECVILFEQIAAALSVVNEGAFDNVRSNRG